MLKNLFVRPRRADARKVDERLTAVHNLARLLEANSHSLLGSFTCEQADGLALMFVSHDLWETAKFVIVRHAVGGLEDDDNDVHGHILNAYRSGNGTLRSDLNAQLRAHTLAYDHILTIL